MMKIKIAHIVVLSALMLVLLGASALADTGPVIKVTLLNQDPNPARAGDTAKLNFMVENSGDGPAQDVQVELLQDYPFTVINGEPVQNLSTLYPFQTGNNQLTVSYDVKIGSEALRNSYPLRLRYRYADNEWAVVEFNIHIVNNQFAQIIYVDKAKIEPGKETPLKFTINNVGSAPLQNLVFSWKEAKGVVLPVYSGDTKYVKYLDVGQSVDLDYTVVADVNAAPGLYELDLTLNYQPLTNATSASIVNTKAGILVGGGTDFDVAFSESSQGQTSLSIANIGNNPASSVSVKIPQQDSFRVTGSNSVIIGNLDKGDYTLASFQIAAITGNFSRVGGQGLGGQGQRNSSSRQLGGNALLVLIDYTDTTGERQEVTKSVPIQFRAADTATGGSQFGNRQATQQKGPSKTWIIAAVVVVAVGLFWYRSRKSKQKLLLRHASK